MCMKSFISSFRVWYHVGFKLLDSHFEVPTLVEVRGWLFPLWVVDVPGLVDDHRHALQLMDLNVAVHEPEAGVVRER